MKGLPRLGRRRPHTDPWRGAHVVITGGSRGIGAAIAEAAVAAGARVSVIARGEDELRAVAARCGGRWAVADVADGAALAAAIARLEAEGGPCDILVCCAGFALPGRFLDTPEDELEAQMRVNFFGTVAAIRAVLAGMLARGRGRVVVTSSTAGLLGVVGYAGYAATKHALGGFVGSLRYEVEPAGVRLHLLHPPDTDTPGFAAENTRKPPECTAVSGAIRVRNPHEVAAAAIEGVRDGRAHITADPATAILVVGGSVLEPLVRPFTTRAIAKALRGTDG